MIFHLLPVCSTGSYGHPELCARPCVFWILNKDCVKGAGCPFCHEHHGSKMSSFDKAQRNIMTRLCDSEKIFLLLPLLQRKVGIKRKHPGGLAFFFFLEGGTVGKWKDSNSIRKLMGEMFLRKHFP